MLLITSAGNFSWADGLSCDLIQACDIDVSTKNIREISGGDYNVDGNHGNEPLNIMQDEYYNSPYVTYHFRHVNLWKHMIAVAITFYSVVAVTGLTYYHTSSTVSGMLVR